MQYFYNDKKAYKQKTNLPGKRQSAAAMTVFYIA